MILAAVYSLWTTPSGVVYFQWLFVHFVVRPADINDNSGIS